MLKEQLIRAVGEEQVRENEPMRLHTSFRIGGPADFLVTPRDEEALRRVLLLCRKEQVPCHVLGNGTNLLVGDGGVRGVVVQLFRNRSHIQVEGEEIFAGAGAMVSGIARAALDACLDGFAFAAGIPGTLGGAVRMNAGAYGGEMKDVILCARVMEQDGRVKEVFGEQLDFGYRHSAVQEKGWIVLDARIGLRRGDAALILAQMNDLKEKRCAKQPLELPSAGSTFKRPQGYFAGKLIQECGLSGFTVGGAMVSPKHCGFVVNKGGASASDVARLIFEVRKIVQEKTGVLLEPEVKMLGEFL